MRQLVKKITNPFLKWAFYRYHSKPRKYTYRGISVSVPPGVFPPHFTISTKILLDYLNKKDLNQKKILELGCGSGIISLFSASKGALVTASDINPIALESLKISSQENRLPIQIVTSDLFDAIEEHINFDIIVINPPYYPKNPKNDKEKAWFCGENFEYFQKLFKQLSTAVDYEITYMILSEDCNISTIKDMAGKNNLELHEIFYKKVNFEKNYIFKILKQVYH